MGLNTNITSTSSVGSTSYYVPVLSIATNILTFLGKGLYVI
ncbi:hypothetical protein KEN49_CDS0058 [Pseudomonas phage vB_Pae3705-KEN49]